MNRFLLSIATALLAAALCAAPAQAGRILGFFNDGVYSDPQKIFTVQSPFPGKPAVLDGIEPDNNGAGAVSFIDQTGELRGILTMRNLGAQEVTTDELRDWFRETGFPKFFKVSLPNAEILRDEPGEIAGNPAWIAAAYLPGGSPLGKIVYGVDEPVHGDSWRGMAVVAHGQRFYLLMTELRVEALATPDWKYDAESADWNQFLPQLVDLYQRIEFLKQ
ncbi:MAG: hypothetical protein WBO00_08590 [Steroidobacteraceae bacterium]